MTYADAIRLSDRLMAPAKRRDPFAELAAAKAKLPRSAPAGATYRSTLGADGHRIFVDARGRRVARKDLPRWVRDMTAGEFANASMPYRQFDLPGRLGMTGGSLTFS